MGFGLSTPTPTLASCEVSVQDPYGQGDQVPGPVFPEDDGSLMPNNRRRAKTSRKKGVQLRRARTPMRPERVKARRRRRMERAPTRGN